MRNVDPKAAARRALNLSLPKGEIRGTGVIRDKHGNVKAHFTIGEGAPVQSSSSEVK